VTTGNVVTDDRVSLFFMDYPNRRRLKLFGHLRDVPVEEPLAGRLVVTGYNGVVQRLALVRLARFDWNCPQHIPQRFTLEELGRS